MSSKPIKLSFSIRSVFVIFLLVAFLLTTWKLSHDLNLTRLKVKRLETVLYDNQTIQIEYGRFLIVNIGSQLYGVRLTESSGLDVYFECYELSGRATEDAGDEKNYLQQLKENGECVSGITNEGQGNSSIPIGPVLMPWSSYGQTLGWLYLSEIDVSIQVYRRQLDEADLEHLHLLDEDFWMSTKPRMP